MIESSRRNVLQDALNKKNNSWLRKIFKLEPLTINDLEEERWSRLLYVFQYDACKNVLTTAQLADDDYINLTSDEVKYMVTAYTARGANHRQWAKDNAGKIAYVVSEENNLRPYMGIIFGFHDSEPNTYIAVASVKNNNFCACGRVEDFTANDPSTYIKCCELKELYWAWAVYERDSIILLNSFKEFENINQGTVVIRLAALMRLAKNNKAWPTFNESCKELENEGDLLYWYRSLLRISASKHNFELERLFLT